MTMFNNYPSISERYIGRLFVCLIITIMCSSVGLFADTLSVNEQKFIVGTKQAPPFAMKTEDGPWTGISIELWQQITSDLNIQYEFRESDLKGLISGIADKTLDASVAALTITSEREKIVDFTHSFHTSGLGIATAAKKKNPWIAVMKRFISSEFLKVIIYLIVILLIVGVLVWWFEHKKNAVQFGSSISKGIGSGFWWSAVTMTTVGYGDKSPATPGGRFIAIIWMFSAIILLSFFTASVTSTLTVTKLESKIYGPDDLHKIRVGTVADSTSEAYLKENHIFYVIYKTAEEGLKELYDGKTDAFVYDMPLLRYLVSKKFQNRLTVHPEKILRQDYGIALQQNSPLREPVNQSLLKIISKAEWQDKLYEYLGE